MHDRRPAERIAEVARRASSSIGNSRANGIQLRGDLELVDVERLDEAVLGVGVRHPHRVAGDLVELALDLLELGVALGVAGQLARSPSMMLVSVAICVELRLDAVVAPRHPVDRPGRLRAATDDVAGREHAAERRGRADGARQPAGIGDGSGSDPIRSSSYLLLAPAWASGSSPAATTVDSRGSHQTRTSSIDHLLLG